MLTLPLGGGLVYIEPVYVQSSGSTSYPLLKKVLVAFGDQVGFADTLDEALNQVFGGNSGALAGDASNNSSSNNAAESNESKDAASKEGSSQEGASKEGTAKENESKNSEKSHSMSQKAKEALKRAAQALKDSDSAMRAGNWEAYGKAQKELSDAIDEAMKEESGK
ncbi:hypothetical protein CG399_07955 [Bifidobacteriaceae bacterium NR015]|nr:hypothetical protein CG399_07955 [Bifidobacteriaceae bacterium NR015]